MEIARIHNYIINKKTIFEGLRYIHEKVMIIQLLIICPIYYLFILFILRESQIFSIIITIIFLIIWVIIFYVRLNNIASSELKSAIVLSKKEITETNIFFYEDKILFVTDEKQEEYLYDIFYKIRFFKKGYFFHLSKRRYFYFQKNQIKGDLKKLTDVLSTYNKK